MSSPCPTGRCPWIVERGGISLGVLNEQHKCTPKCLQIPVSDGLGRRLRIFADGVRGTAQFLVRTQAGHYAADGTGWLDGDGKFGDAD
jgi:hypothetical protein